MVKGVSEAALIDVGLQSIFYARLHTKFSPCPLEERGRRSGGEQSDDYSTRRVRMAFYVRRLRDERSSKGV